MKRKADGNEIPMTLSHPLDDVERHQFPARANPGRLRVSLGKKQDPEHADVQHSARLISRVSIKICGFLTRSNLHIGTTLCVVLFIRLFSSRASLSRISYSIAESPSADLLNLPARYPVTLHNRE